MINDYTSRIGHGIRLTQRGGVAVEPEVYIPRGSLLFNDTTAGLDAALEATLWKIFQDAGYHFSAWLADTALYGSANLDYVDEFVSDYGNEYQVYMARAVNTFKLLDGEHLEDHITDAVAAGGITLKDDPVPDFAGQKIAEMTVVWPEGSTPATHGIARLSGEKVPGGSTISAALASTSNVLFIPAGAAGVPAAMCGKPLWANAAKQLRFGNYPAHTYFGEAGGFTNDTEITLYEMDQYVAGSTDDEHLYGYTHHPAGLAAYLLHWNYCATAKGIPAPAGWSESNAKGFLPTQQEIVAAGVLAGLENYYATGSNIFMLFRRESVGVIGHHMLDNVAAEGAKEAMWAQIADETRRGGIIQTQLSDYASDPLFTLSETPGDWAILSYLLAKCKAANIPVILPTQMPYNYYDTSIMDSNSLPSLSTDLINAEPTTPTGWTIGADATANVNSGTVSIDQTGAIALVDDLYAFRRGISEFSVLCKNDGSGDDTISVTARATTQTKVINGTGWQELKFFVPVAQVWNGAIDIAISCTVKNSTGDLVISEPSFKYLYDVHPPVITLPAEPITTKNTTTITSASGGATIYYTTNGDTPTADSTEYTGAFRIAEGTDIVLKAIAIEGAYSSSVTATETFDVISGYEDETDALLTAMGASAPTDGDIIDAYDELFYALKNATVSGSPVNLLAKLDCLELFYTAHSDMTDAMLNVINPAGTGASRGKTGAADFPTWAAKAGFTTDAANYIDTGFIPSAGTKYKAQASDGSCMGIVQHTDPTASNNYDFGAQAAAGTSAQCIARLREAGSGNVAGRLNGGSLQSSAAISSTTKRYLLFTRLAGGNSLYMADENAYATLPANAEGTIPDVSVWIGGYNVTGTLTSGKVTYPAMYYAGSGMTEAQWIVFRGILAAYLAAMAAI